QDGDTAGNAGATNSINRATGFFSAAGLALLRLDTAVQSAVMPSFYRTILVMSSGQHTEAARSIHTLEDYMDLISAKSGRFFALATSCGAYCGTKNELVVSLLDDFGFNVGIFIQIADDYLDWHNPGFANISSGTPTLPICFIRSLGTEEQQAQLEQLLARTANFDGQRNRTEIQKLASEVGAEAYMLAEMVRHKVRALATLDELDKLSVGSHNTKSLRDWFNRFSAFAPA
ncbi:MAG: polyprenyl synthetase family protein, partial [Chloroflexia bacterium]